MAHHPFSPLLCDFQLPSYGEQLELWGLLNWYLNQPYTKLLELSL